ncbi:hypothetical protein KR51_00002380 [Rubidibacter lacunae KORDI 51-2]|uniref:DUF427 domain-containing protein n=1 Tax=Rubidibacter lacunae KORDI 51-2 TaxID=582515 RepID=U5DQN3_9CHRO|nr:DUF427 domain-containing protein [Rubidibacter lacunae]ERN42934.1 hypothetical protein KR51_00002380 [Rubidibacter lacunae KORDI 51-2]
MTQATWNGVVLANSQRCERVEGNEYFPPDDVYWDYFQGTDTHTVCPWKGTASYYTITIGGESLSDAAWSYPQAKERAKHIEGYVAFYTRKGVIVS